MSNSDVNQFIEIETKIAFLEDLVESLNKTVIKQDRRIEELENICNHLFEKLQIMNESLEQEKNSQDDSADMEYEIPPHY